ncbi:MAG: FHA domain-containing protein [Geodermatophilaceae bacterium]
MNRVVVSSPDGQRHALTGGQSLIFGRPGGGADLLLAGDVHLSRHHGLVQALDRGWVLTNVSEVNALYVDMLDGLLIPLRPGSRWNSDRAMVAVGTATMVHQERPVTVACTVLPEPEAAVRHELPAVTGEPTMPGAGVVFAEDAQYFLTAALLCSPWLRDPMRLRRLPSAAEIGAEVAALTGVPPGPGLLEELERYVVTDLKTLKQKMLDARVFTERPVSLGMVAAALIGHGLVTPRHLRRITEQAREWRYRWGARLTVGDGGSKAQR